jgi:flavin reductase (DIM6/NTAB) family NADH-FMN oxidoreductase RutF
MTTLHQLEADLIEQDEPQLTPEQYKTVFRQHAAGVAVVTLLDDAGPVGFTATSVISVSASPPLLAFSIDSGSSSWPALSRAKSLVVSFLAHDQAALSGRFAARGVDRFAEGGWSQLPTGEPVLDGVQSWVRGRVVQRTPVGTSFLVSVRALDHATRPEAEPLVYRDRAYYALTPQD